MQSHRLDPYLWVHLAGLAAVPLWFNLCLLGLAAGEPRLPPAIELTGVSALGVAPMLWMQWRKPFCIFSLLFLALRPDSLGEERRQMLTLFRGKVPQIIALLVPLLLVPLLWQIDRLVPLAASITPIANHSTGLLVAALAFLLANLFTQVPAAVVRVLLASERQVAQAVPYPVEQIGRDFTLLGWPVRKILPDLVSKGSSASLEQPLATDNISPENVALAAVEETASGDMFSNQASETAPTAPSMSTEASISAVDTPEAVASQDDTNIEDTDTGDNEYQPEDLGSVDHPDDPHFSS